MRAARAGARGSRQGKVGRRRDAASRIKLAADTMVELLEPELAVFDSLNLDRTCSELVREEACSCRSLKRTTPVTPKWVSRSEERAFSYAFYCRCESSVKTEEGEGLAHVAGLVERSIRTRAWRMAPTSLSARIGGDACGREARRWDECGDGSQRESSCAVAHTNTRVRE